MNSSTQDSFLCRIQVLTRHLPTPFFVFDLDSLGARIEETKVTWRRFFPNVLVAYSFKSNPVRAILQRMQAAGLAAEVVSERELEEAIRLGFETVIFNGPVKKPAGLRNALRRDVRIQVDSLEELRRILRQLEAGLGTTSLSFRLASPRKEVLSRFGLSPAEFDDGLEILAAQGLSLSGIHIHAGSNFTTTDTLIKALEWNRERIARAYAARDIRRSFWIDVGGGYPARSVLGKGAFIETGRFVENVRKFFDADTRISADFELVIEPGRCLVEDYGYLVSCVECVKKRSPRPVVVIDAGSHLVTSLHRQYHPIEWLDPWEEWGMDVDVRGADCFEGDMIATGLPSPRTIREGERVVIGSVGGYDVAMAFVWTRKVPAIWGIEKNTLILLRSETDLRHR